MKNHNKSLNYQIKSLFFKLSKLSLILSLFLIMILQTGCATKDEEAPVITNVQVKDNVVTIEANDNVGVTGYISVSHPRQPSLTDENWQESNSITLDEDGTYYIWVKDASDNLARHTETIEVSYNLALKFDHLNWLTPAEGTRVVDGVTYNLAELKAEYGDLYRLVEPLTEGQIENRFEYLARFMEMQRDEALRCDCLNWYIEGGLKSNNQINEENTKLFNSNMDLLYKANNNLFDLFKKYYTYNLFLSGYVVEYPSSFTSEIGVNGVGTDIIDTVSIDDKEFFVRDFTYQFDKFLKIYAKLGLEPEYVIENWDWKE